MTATSFLSYEYKPTWEIKVCQEKGSSWVYVRIYRDGKEIDNNYAESTPPFWVWSPCFIERWFGVTMESKIRNALAKAHAYVASNTAMEARTRAAVKRVANEFKHTES